ncbi:T9SS type A sorting domain-containing protein [Chryseobacterium vrystaatense]|uniref:Por secretion system C-terminal sorting domain-containing protein n=1 Tax=Chryseobacterium vrystaatense TaxID=307480 RepID=A0A1M5F764_9FLAO|nr:T9SS type A sorting domain-containing protein [Chryseobacterium vrystaatense]SHF87335.1 Por secretion system C-terminal sorting domain-containing protein [Chryseobacterium vrystaatense]
MKKLLLPAAFIISTLFQAQSTELVNTTWYLKKVVKNSTTYMLPQNSEIGTPTMAFTPSGMSGYTNMSSPICGTSMWGNIHESDITPAHFVFWTYGVGTNQTCTTPENSTFFTQYANYFAFNSEQHNYQITNSGNTRNLVITNNLGDQAFYESSFLAARETISSGKPSVKIYPNPVKDGFLEIQGVERIESTKIYNAEGRLVFENSNDSKINVSSLSKGGYFLEIKSQQGISRHKFIKE